MPEFDSSLRNFIWRHIDSVEQIEVLLLLHSNRDVVWPADKVASTLRAHERSIARRLAALERSRLVAREENGYRYRAAGRLDEMVQRLSSEFAVRRTSVIHVVYERPDAAELFADAFRLWDDDDDDN